MARSARLLALLQALRGRRRPATASTLADELGVSLRTIYRDIAALIAQGAPIMGEAGLGYVLGPGHFLPPLMLDGEEADAVMLGLRLVGQRTDEGLAAAAARAAAKIGAVLPSRLGDAVEVNGLLAGPRLTGRTAPLRQLREAMRTERKVVLRYLDRAGTLTERVVWPVAIGFFDAAEVLAAWCEMRGDYRHFRLDRIQAADVTAEPLPRRRGMLLAAWRAAQPFDRPSRPPRSSDDDGGGAADRN